MKKIKIVSRSVNNKTLFREIHGVIFEAIESLGVKWSSDAHRSSFIELIEDYLFDVENEGRIEQTKVICDKRNNKSFSSLAVEYIFEVRYRQVGCLNVTSIEYRVQNRK